MESKLPPDDLFYFGYVTRAHGIRGELRIQAQVDDPLAYAKIEAIRIGLDSISAKSHAVEALRWQDGGSAILKLKGIDSRNQSELLAGKRLYLDQALLPPLESGGFYYHDVIGFDLVDQHLGLLAPVQDVIELPGQDAFQLFIDGVEVLIPIVDDWILEVDLESGKIQVQLPAGLVELYLEDRPRKAHDV